METSESDYALSLMRAHAYFRGLAEEILEEVAAHAKVRRFDVGDVVYAANQPVTDIGFLVAGRLKGMVVDPQGTERLLRFAERGESIGMVSAAVVEPLPVTAVAVEPSTVLFLDYEESLELTARHPALRKHWAQRLAAAVRASVLGDAPRRESSVIALVHDSPATRRLTPLVVQRLRDLGEDLAVLSDRPNSPAPEEVPFRCVVEQDRWLDEAELHQQIAKWGKPNRLIVDVDAAVGQDRIAEIVGLSHFVLWVTTPGTHQDAYRRLKGLEADSPALRDKISLVWMLEEDHLAPAACEMREVTARGFKVSDSPISSPLGRTVSAGLERLIHYLRGIQIGLALGGGAARGMAHLGVLRALEEGGIVVDRIAGTSAGAMTGILYGAGIDPSYIAESFVRDLKPSWLFRSLPRGSYWYLMYKYRRGQFEPMLRKYLSTLQLDQLPVPSSSVTVDLVSGEALVRQSGDAVQAILESINLPLLSTPIVHQGQALIDGGFVNNVPADVLVSQGCNLVIAVDVMAKIEREFGGVRAGASGGDARAPNAVQTLLRTYAVQSYNMKSVGAQPADLRIEPDVSDFSMAAFTQAKEMADIGDQAAKEKLPVINSLLASLENRK